MVLVYLALLAGWFVGGIFLGRWLEDRKVQRELKAIVIGFQIGMVNQCPVCKQAVPVGHSVADACQQSAKASH